MEPRTRSRREDRPEIILDAAEGVLRRLGARALTIDAVAAEAALSKGGVLHHYASKDSLIRALATRKLNRLRNGIAGHEARQDPPSGSPARAMVANARETYCEEHGFPRALLLASAEMPGGLAEFRGFITERLAQMARCEGSPGSGAVFVFAIIGLMVGRTLGFHELSGEEADRIFDALDTMAIGLGCPQSDARPA